MKIAVVGGGITGAVVASELARALALENTKDGDNDGERKSNIINNSVVVVFDQGRRGPGGRASHRAVAMTSTPNVSVAEEGNDPEGTTQWNFEVLTNDDDIDPSALHFDHGCQFFRADTPAMKDLVERWRAEGWVEEWNARFGSLPEPEPEIPSSSSSSSPLPSECSPKEDNDNPKDFFGIPSLSPNRINVGETGTDTFPEQASNPVYIGVGGMHLLPRRILESSSPFVKVHKGTRVSGVKRRKRRKQNATDDDNDKVESNTESSFLWDVTTTVGAAAFHDTSESKATEELARAVTTEASAAGEDPSAKNKNNHKNNTTRIVVHRGFDAVVFTDISSSSEPWHRASAGGIPESFRSRLPTKFRVPLFSCMIALRSPVRHLLPYDAFVASSSSSSSSISPLWFAACSQSKPGVPTPGPAECWTLVSTPSFAVDEIRDTTMRDPVTGAFRPQENDYLNVGPGPKLAEAFFDLVRPYRGASTGSDESVLYLQAQRWGTGLPIDPDRAAVPPEDICGTRYVSRFRGSLVYGNDDDDDDDDAENDSRSNFVADDDQGLYYAGDFCSHLNPGMEAASLSGKDLAEHILSRQSPR
mmetsp:Transcript_20598/g.57153  ORF Transcript_20598/g.57153 Transcript_20598/m.57153 type:complete len:588 (+) Transcript_20598:211-1974(+)|eukprot:CAMPEP_0172359640 /NCGR_PEP_ID=MMETSP1060-20121228/3833_1 /TAXON_ID=37318 /ORGANISM="Pseudo-nitzschia pungens, Strain cf. cingulata" /LENGTH=587 /DNA_ID=CAMNT_0013081401 /DNA_START=140 /DNA_END=1903 /DNA_ORIENTATION=+